MRVKNRYEIRKILNRDLRKNIIKISSTNTDLQDYNYIEINEVRNDQ